MKKVMVHIDDDQDYDAINELRSIINEKYNDSIKYPKLFRDNRLIDKLNKLKTEKSETFRQVCDDSLNIRDLAKKLRVTYRQLRKKKHPLGWLLLSSLFLFVTSPVFAVGSLLNLLMYEASDRQSLKSKDPAFISTARYGFMIGLSFVFAPLYLALALIFIKPWWLAIMAFLLIPALGIIAWNWHLLFLRTLGGFRIRKLISTHNPDFIKLDETYRRLVQQITVL